MKFRTVAFVAALATLAATAVANASTTSTEDHLYAAGSMTYNNVTLVGGELAVVAVKPEGNTVLHLSVYDANGHMIEQTNCYESGCWVRFTPAWTGNFNIVVANLGDYQTDFGIAVRQ